MIKKYIQTLNGMQEVEMVYNDPNLSESMEQVVIEMGQGDVLTSFVSENPDSVSFLPNPDPNSERGVWYASYDKRTAPVVIKFGDAQSVTNLISVLMRIERAMMEKQ